MKVYRQEDEHYPATYSFKGETDGTSGTSIDFIDTFTTTDTNGAVVVFSEQDDHKKVLKISGDGDNGTNTNFFHNFSSGQTSGIVEFWFNYVDNGQGYTRFYLRDETPATAIYGYINHADNKFYVAYGDGVGGQTWVNDAVTAATWYHVRFVFDCDDDTFSYYLDGVSKIADQNFYSDQDATTLDTFRLYQDNGGGANALESYFDAFGESWDSDYAIGDNTRDWDWTILSSVLEISDISTEKNMIGHASVLLGDSEGSLYTTWQPLDHIHMAITDGTGASEDWWNENVIFRGFLVGKQFRHNRLLLQIKGLAERLNWHEFDFNYNLSNGKINTVSTGGDTTRLTMYEDDEVTPFTWDNDMWIGDRLTGLLLVDNTSGLSSELWQATAISHSGNGTVTGDHTGTTGINDNSFYDCGGDQPTQTAHYFVITPTIGGANIPTTNILEKIVVNFKIGYRIYCDSPNEWMAIAPQVNKDGTWYPLGEDIRYYHPGGGMTDRIWVGCEEDEDGNINDLFTFTESDTELAKYLTEDAGNYDEIKGIRFIVRTSESNVMGSNFSIDYLGVTVYYSTYTFSPIMKAISDNTATDIYCSDTNWDEEHVAQNDLFYIGENTHKILGDISLKSGIPIHMVYDTTESTLTLRPDGDLDVNWQEYGAGGDHYDKVNDEVDQPDAPTCVNSRVQAEEADDNEYEAFTMENLTFRNGNITDITVWAYGRKAANTDNALVDVSFDGGTTYLANDATDFDTDYAWDSFTWADLNGGAGYSAQDCNSLIVRFKSQAVPAGEYLTLCGVYAVITYTSCPFDKFTASNFRGNYCFEAFQSICDLEGCFWYEDYVNNRIVIVKKDDVESSGESYTQTSYEWDWMYDDQCNQYKAIEVIGDADNDVYQKVIDDTVTNTSKMVKQFIDTKIKTNGDAYEIGYEQLQIYKVKRPSIKFSVNGVQSAVVPAKTVNLTMVRPTVAATDYIVRKIVRSERGTDGIKTTIYAGLGETEYLEKIGKEIVRAKELAHKALTNRQT